MGPRFHRSRRKSCSRCNDEADGLARLAVRLYQKFQGQGAAEQPIPNLRPRDGGREDGVDDPAARSCRGSSAEGKGEGKSSHCVCDLVDRLADSVLTMAKTVPRQTMLLTAGLLLAAGFETTSSLVTATLYLLLRNPHCLEKVTREVRSSFKSQDDISFAALDNLTYIVACLNEALRWDPPIAGGLPRAVMKGGTAIAGRPVPENVWDGILSPHCSCLSLTLHRPLSLYTTGQSTTPRPTFSSPMSTTRSAGSGMPGSPPTSWTWSSRSWLARGTALAGSECKVPLCSRLERCSGSSDY